MNRVLTPLMLAYLVLPLRAQAESPAQLARTFLPPSTQLAELYTFDYRTGRVSSRFPAVVTGHIVSPESDDVVFAYYSPRVDVMEKTLFITVLHPTSSGYQKEYELAYRSEVLLVPSAVQVLHLDGLATDVIAVIHGVGAALGGEIDVFRWEEPRGLENIFPANNSAHYFSILPDHGRVKVRIGYGKAINAAPSEEYIWNSKEFVKTQ